MSSASGRWPANTVLVHETGCRPDGTTMVPGYVINRHVGGAHPFGDAAGVAYESERLPDERVVKWVCQDGCAVMALDRQSGDRPSTLTGRADPRGPHPHPATATRKRGVVYGDPQGDVALNDPGTRVYADGGGASRFFKQTRRADMKDGIPQELWDYLVTMISPPPSCEPVIIAEADLASVDFAALADKSVHGIVTVGDPSPWMKEIDRVLRPGAHLLLISDEDDPTGTTGACAVEDFGYEIRDAIAVLDTPGEFHYVAKASTTERNAGVVPREKVIRSERLFPREDESVEDLREELSENVDKDILERMVEDGLAVDDVPDEMRERFDTRTVEKKRIVQSDHPTVKPVAVMEALLRDVSDGALVCDPFMGSGTTGLACMAESKRRKKGHGLNFVGIEQDVEYAQIAEQRVRWKAAETPGDLSPRIESEVPPMENEAEQEGGIFGLDIGGVED
jgi:DNA modification methylase